MVIQYNQFTLTVCWYALSRIWNENLYYRSQDFILFLPSYEKIGWTGCLIKECSFCGHTVRTNKQRLTHDKLHCLTSSFCSVLFSSASLCCSCLMVCKTTLMCFLCGDGCICWYACICRTYLFGADIDVLLKARGTTEWEYKGIWPCSCRWAAAPALCWPSECDPDHQPSHCHSDPPRTLRGCEAVLSGFPPPPPGMRSGQCRPNHTDH